MKTTEATQTNEELAAGATVERASEDLDEAEKEMLPTQVGLFHHSMLCLLARSTLDLANLSALLTRRFCTLERAVCCADGAVSDSNPPPRINAAMTTPAPR